MFITYGVCNAQILCIYCYEQNDSISTGVNNLLLNGGFENGCNPDSVFCPNSQYYSCDIINWTCTGGGIATYAQSKDTAFSFIPEGAKAAYFGNYFCKACSPVTFDTSCLINLGCTVAGVPAGYPVNNPSHGGTIGVSLEQSVSGLIPGNTYVLEFWAGGEPFIWIKKGLFAVDVGFGDTLFRDKSTAPDTGIGTRFIIEFNATSSSHTIKFTNWGHICDSCTELVLDDVRLYTLAELSASVPHCTLGINDTSALQSAISISPNPVINELKVKTNYNQLSEIIIYDFTSRKILEKKFTNSTSINTGQLAKGIYLYEVRNKSGVIKKGKIVKD